MSLTPARLERIIKNTIDAHEGVTDIGSRAHNAMRAWVVEVTIRMLYRVPDLYNYDLMDRVPERIGRRTYIPRKLQCFPGNHGIRPNRPVDPRRLDDFADRYAREIIDWRDLYRTQREDSCPFIPLFYRGTVINPVNFEPVLSFETRYICVPF